MRDEYNRETRTINSTKNVVCKQLQTDRYGNDFINSGPEHIEGSFLNALSKW